VTHKTVDIAKGAVHAVSSGVGSVVDDVTNIK